MRRTIHNCLALLACGVILLAASASATGVALTPESETGFKHFIRMAQQGELGADVDNANVAISKQGTSIELTRQGEAGKLFHLTPKTGEQSYSRYFDIAIGGAAKESDILRVGAALDEAFERNPYELSGVEAVPGWTPPTWRRAWQDDGWHGLVRAAEMRAMQPVSRAYAMATTTGVALLLGLSCAALWLDGIRAGAATKRTRAETQATPRG